MKIRFNGTDISEAKTASSWELGTLAPSLASTDDWWNQAARLDPIAEELFRTHVETNENTPALAKRQLERARPPRCPACGSIIYSRRFQQCGVCAKPLPSEAIFSEAQSVRVERIVEIDRQRHRQWLARAEG